MHDVVSDNAGIEVDDFEASQSVGEYLREMEDGDLLQLAGELKELIEHPGWQHLGELIRVHQRRIRSGAGAPVWSQALLGKPMPEMSALYVAAGRVRGMDEIVHVVQGALRMAAATEREIAKTGD